VGGLNVDFAEQFSQRPVKKAQRVVRHTVKGIVTETPFPAVSPDECPTGQAMMILGAMLDGPEESPGHGVEQDKAEAVQD